MKRFAFIGSTVAAFAVPALPAQSTSIAALEYTMPPGLLMYGSKMYGSKRQRITVLLDYHSQLFKTFDVDVVEPFIGPRPA